MPMRRKAAWVASKPSRVITLGLAVALECLTEEGLGGGDITGSTEVGFDGFALFINRAVEVHPLTAYFEVGQESTRQESPTGRSQACQHFSNSGT
jgi:hypothetical protein